jgi:hypothetical protein
MKSLHRPSTPDDSYVGSRIFEIGQKSLRTSSPLLNTTCGLQTAGLGSRRFDPYIANPSLKDRRENVMQTLIAHQEEDFLRHAATCVRQGVWTHWENVILLISHGQTLSTPGSLIKFVLTLRSTRCAPRTCCIFLATCPRRNASCVMRLNAPCTMSLWAVSFPIDTDPATELFEVVVLKGGRVI